jgi:hypothetical protein
LHDRARVYATAFSLNEDDHSPWRRKIVESIERFLDMTGLFYSGGELAVAQRIQQERIDVLINLAGHTRANDMVTKICAYRPAPVQMLHLGYAGSMGRNLVDLHVTDRFGFPFTISMCIIPCITRIMVPHASSNVTAARFSSPVEFRRHYDEALLYAIHFIILKIFLYLESFLPQLHARQLLRQRLHVYLQQVVIRDGFVFGVYGALYQSAPTPRFVLTFDSIASFVASDEERLQLLEVISQTLCPFRFFHFCLSVVAYLPCRLFTPASINCKMR